MCFADSLDVFLGQPEDAMVRQMTGEPLPDFDLPTIDGGAQSLVGGLVGRRGAVVVFWSGICSHCQRYDAYLNGFAARYDDLVLLAVASRQDESAEDVRRAVAERHLGFQILHDADRRVARAWLVEQTPRVFLLDGSRRLLYRGAIDNFKYPNDPEHEPYLEPAIGSFLAGRSIVRTETPSFGCAIESVYYQIPKPMRS